MLDRIERGTLFAKADILAGAAATTSVLVSLNSQGVGGAFEGANKGIFVGHLGLLDDV